MMVKICAIAYFSTTMPRWRDYCAPPRRASCSTNTSPRMVQPSRRIAILLANGFAAETTPCVPGDTDAESDPVVRQSCPPRRSDRLVSNHRAVAADELHLHQAPALVVPYVL